MKIGLVTISTPKYIKGTRVLFFSFLKNNPWFNGELLCIDGGLTVRNRSQLKRFNPTFITPSEDLLAKINKIDSISNLNYGRLLALEAFRIAGDFDKLLFLDSDMLCVGNLRALFEMNDNCACLDSCILRGKVRDARTFDQIEASHAAGRNTLNTTINSGMLLLQKEALGKYRHLVNAISAEAFKEISENLGDETIINLNINGFFKIIPGEYNYRIHLENDHLKHENIRFTEAKIHHFTGKNKPWKIASYLILIKRSSLYIKFLNLWLKYYVKELTCSI